MKLIQGSYGKTIEYCAKMFDGKFFEFELPYVSTDNHFCEIDRFLYESRHTLRFKNHYEGNVVIDLSDWNDRDKVNNYFESFMYFLKDNADIYNCVFIVDKKCSSKIIKMLKELFEIEITELDVPATETKTRIGFYMSKEG